MTTENMPGDASTSENKVLARIDRTLTFYSAGLDAELAVPVELSEVAVVEAFLRGFDQVVTDVMGQLRSFVAETLAPALQQFVAALNASGVMAAAVRQKRRERLGACWSDWQLHWDMIDMKRARSGSRWRAVDATSAHGRRP